MTQPVPHVADYARRTRGERKGDAGSDRKLGGRGYGGAPPHIEDGSAEAVLHKLYLTVTRKLDGLLQGDHLGLLPGPGSEPGESREYRPGDDVRRMDWPVTARTTVPHVRQTVADRELETWMCVDLSASLDFGTAECEKRDLAIAAATAIAHLTVRGGNRIGAVVTNGKSITRFPAQPGRMTAQGMLTRVATTPRATISAPSRRRRRKRDGVPTHAFAGPAGFDDQRADEHADDLAGAIDRLNRPPRRRGLAVVISDFLSPDLVAGAASGGATVVPGWERPMRRLGVRHDVLAIEVLDPRELELPAVGVLTVVDPETGTVHEVQTSQRELREQFAQAAADQRNAIAKSIRRAGAAHLRLRTDSDWLLDIVRFVAAQRRGRSRGTSR